MCLEPTCPNLPFVAEHSLLGGPGASDFCVKHGSHFQTSTEVLRKESLVWRQGWNIFFCLKAFLLLTTHHADLLSNPGEQEQQDFWLCLYGCKPGRAVIITADGASCSLAPFHWCPVVGPGLRLQKSVALTLYRNISKVRKARLGSQCVSDLCTADRGRQDPRQCE